MEKIVINGLLYKVRNGTNKKISEALRAAGNAPASAHESGEAHEPYNALLWQIIENKKGEYIENAYYTT